MSVPFEKAFVHVNGAWEDAEFVVVTQPWKGVTEQEVDERKCFIAAAIREKLERERSK